MRNNFYLYKVHAVESDDPTKTLQECGIVNAPSYNEAVANITDWYGDNEIFELSVESIGTDPITLPESLYEAVQKNDFSNISITYFDSFTSTSFSATNDLNQLSMNPQYFPQ